MKNEANRAQWAPHGRHERASKWPCQKARRINSAAWNLYLALQHNIQACVSVGVHLLFGHRRIALAPDGAQDHRLQPLGGLLDDDGIGHVHQRIRDSVRKRLIGCKTSVLSALFADALCGNPYRRLRVPMRHRALKINHKRPQRPCRRLPTFRCMTYGQA